MSAKSFPCAADPVARVALWRAPAAARAPNITELRRHEPAAVAAAVAAAQITSIPTKGKSS